MKAIYNSRITDQANIQISANNRGFSYGDGLFETIVTGRHRINLIDKHLERLAKHARLLSIEINDKKLQEFKNEINKLTIENNLLDNCRTKLMVWRKSGGLYASDRNDFEYLILQKETEKPIYQVNHQIGISEKAINHYTFYSCIKSLNALNYVIAGGELLEKKLDEIILLDTKDNLSETHLGNLFWVIDEQIYTPSIKTGCIEGIMRNHIIDFFKAKGNPIHIVEMNADVLLKAQAVFSTNASGITAFNSIAHRKDNLMNPEEELAELIKQLQRP